MAVVRTKSKIKYIGNTEKDVEAQPVTLNHAQKLLTDSLKNAETEKSYQHVWQSAQK